MCTPLSKSWLITHWRLPVLLFILFNWIWSLGGAWEIELGGVGYSGPGSGGEGITKGLYCEDGCLLFASTLSTPSRCAPSVRTRPEPPRPVTVYVAGPELSYRWTGSRGDWHVDQLRRNRLLTLGFAARWAPRDQVFPTRAVAILWWLLFTVFVLEPVRRMLRPWWNARKLRRTGLCPICGYDLRATPERCPECGHIIAEYESSLLVNKRSAGVLTRSR